MTEETEFGVVEMGASAQGEIELLAGIAAPDFGLITNIGRAHLEGFGGEEGVRKGKGELYDYLASAGGTAIVRSDDPVLAEMASQRNGLKINYYDIHYADGAESRLAGDYNRANIAAAVAAGRMFGIPDEAIKEAVRDYEPGNNRSQLIDTGRNVVLADCYNANPSSMAAAIGNFASGSAADFFQGAGPAPGIAAAGQDRNAGILKKTAILGDMMELGRWSAPEHEKIAELALGSNFDNIIFVGVNFMRAVKRLAGANVPPHVKTLSDTGELKEYLSGAALSNNIILLKGSRSMKLEEAAGLL
jgi:UDP-N-acetylmuramoyl-tripeptide--D-alanyl-D-alanine ligase